LRRRLGGLDDVGADARLEDPQLEIARQADDHGNDKRDQERQANA